MTGQSFQTFYHSKIRVRSRRQNVTSNGRFTPRRIIKYFSLHAQGGEKVKDGYLKVGLTRSGRSVYISFVIDIKQQIISIQCEFDHEEIFDVYAIF